MNVEESLNFRQRSYDGIKDIKDDNTRRLIYLQFVSKYYPEAFSVLTKGDDRL